MVLHLIQRSPFASTALADCLKIIDKEDSILFMQDGVYALNHESLEIITNTYYCLQDDTIARGLKHDCAGKFVSYQNFVSLCTQHKKVISWF